MAVRRGAWIVFFVIVFAVSLSVLGMVLIVAAVGREPDIASNSTLVIRVGGDLNEMEPGGVFGPFIEAGPTVRGLVEMLRKAKTDKRITSVVLKPTGSGALWGKLQEVRDAVADFRKSGKPIVAYLEYGGEQEFYLATACTSATTRRRSTPSPSTPTRRRIARWPSRSTRISTSSSSAASRTGATRTRPT